MANVGKVLVTTPLVLQAVSKGLLTLESTLSDFFEDVPAEKENITIKQLLTHTSGIVRNPIPKEIFARNNKVIVSYILSFELAFEPGTNFQYSCAGMMLLGYILEKIYDQTLDEENLYE